MTMELADAGLAPLEPRLPSILIGEAGELPPADAARAGERSPQGQGAPPPTLQQALAVLAGCGCPGRGAESAPILAESAAILAEPVVAELLVAELVEREPGYRRLTDSMGPRGAALWLLESEIVPWLPADEPAAPTATKPLRASADAEEELTVTGTRPKDFDDSGSMDPPGEGGDPMLGGGETGMGGGGGGDLPAPTPPDMECLTAEEKSQLSEKDREAYEVAEEAAAIAREILQQPDRDFREYGSVIYRDIYGAIRHTTLAGGTATQVSLSLSNAEDFGMVLAIVHSHPAITYGADAYGNFDFKLYPTPGPDGDWAALDSFVSGAYNNLINQGFSHEQALAKVSSIHQYIVGPKGVAGTNLYEIRKYESHDRDLTTLGQKIPETLGQCNG